MIRSYLYEVFSVRMDQNQTETDIYTNSKKTHLFDIMSMNYSCSVVCILSNIKFYGLQIIQNVFCLLIELFQTLRHFMLHFAIFYPGTLSISIQNGIRFKNPPHIHMYNHIFLILKKLHLTVTYLIIVLIDDLKSQRFIE